MPNIGFHQQNWPGCNVSSGAKMICVLFVCIFVKTQKLLKGWKIVLIPLTTLFVFDWGFIYHQSGRCIFARKTTAILSKRMNITLKTRGEFAL